MDSFIFPIRYAHDEHEWRTRARRELAVELWRQFGKARARRPRMLDLGCGTGVLLRDLAPFGDVVGIDVADLAVHYARQRGQLTTAVATSTALPFGPRSFDLVTMIEVLEHVDDDRAALREICAALRPGGILALTVPAFTFLWTKRDLALQHKRRYTLHQLRRRVKEAGLCVEWASYIDLFLLAPMLAIAIAHRLAPRVVKFDTYEVTAPGPLNGVLLEICRAERRLYLRQPFSLGLSIALVARRGG